MRPAPNTLPGDPPKKSPWLWSTGGIEEACGCDINSFSDIKNEVMLLLENTVGTKNSMVGSFGYIAAIIDSLDDKRIGVCLDPTIFLGPDMSWGRRMVSETH